MRRIEGMRNQGGCCSLGKGTQPVQAKMEMPGKVGQKLVGAFLLSCSNLRVGIYLSHISSK